jgi:GTPase SAR1 family protein
MSSSSLKSEHIEISDIEKVNFLYKDECPVKVQIWDTVGLEKYSENFIYSQSYVQGKQGIVLVADSEDFTLPSLKG